MNTKISAACIVALSATCLALTAQLYNMQDIIEMHESTEVHLKQELSEAAVAQIQELEEPKVFEYNSVAAPIYDIPLSEDLQNYTYAVCDEYGIVDDYEIILALMWQESDFVADTISATDDYGLMQINKINHSSLTEILLVDNYLDPYQNIYAGVYILSNLLNKYDDAHQALMAYNMGPTNAAALWSNGIYSSCYSREVLDKSNRLNDYNSEK